MKRASPCSCSRPAAASGGTWFWNRYPGARFDSESYTYGYLFSKELFDEWEWQEHFAEQPETERYLNHVVDRFDLRRHMRFDAHGHLGRVRRAVGDVDGGGRRRHRAPGAVPRRRDRRALGAVLPGRAGARRLPRRAAPHRAVAGDAGRLRRQARRRHRHRIERRADDPGHRRRGRLADRVPAHRQLVHAAQQRADHRRGAGAAPGRLRGDPRDAEHVGRTGSSTPRTIAPRSTTRRRSGGRSSRRCGTAPASRSSPATTPTCCSIPTANAEWCEFIAEKIRGIVDDPETAEKLIPKDHRFGEKRPPFVTGYYEAFNQPERLARRSRADADRAHDRDAGSRRPTACGSSTSSCGRPASTSAPARSRAWGSAAATVSRSRTTGPTVRRRSSASRPPASRTSSSPAGRTRRPATTRATTATRSTSSPTRSSTCATTATTRSRSTPRPRSGGPTWSTAARRCRPFGESSYYFGTNIPGKPRRYLLNAGGRPKLFKEIAEGRARPTTRRSRRARRVVRRSRSG